MRKDFFIAKPFVAAALLSAVSLAQADIDTYNDSGSFLAALSGYEYGVDDYQDLGAGSLGKSITRFAGDIEYEASTRKRLVADDVDGSIALSTNKARAKITFSDFGTDVMGIGADFFPADMTGVPVTSKLILKVVETDGTVTRIRLNGQTFKGLVSDEGIASLTVFTKIRGNMKAWPTVDNLTLVSATPVPEPETYALMIGGLAAIGFVASRRRQG
jgi:PEP-CTERM motif